MVRATAPDDGAATHVAMRSALDVCAPLNKQTHPGSPRVSWNNVGECSARSEVRGVLFVNGYDPINKSGVLAKPVTVLSAEKACAVTA